LNNHFVHGIFETYFSNMLSTGGLTRTC